jgi:hypothetical protein
MPCPLEGPGCPAGPTRGPRPPVQHWPPQAESPTRGEAKGSGIKSCGCVLVGSSFQGCRDRFASDLPGRCITSWRVEICFDVQPLSPFARNPGGELGHWPGLAAGGETLGPGGWWAASSRTAGYVGPRAMRAGHRGSQPGERAAADRERVGPPEFGTGRAFGPGPRAIGAKP